MLDRWEGEKERERRKRRKIIGKGALKIGDLGIGDLEVGLSMDGPLDPSFFFLFLLFGAFGGGNAASAFYTYDTRR